MMVKRRATRARREVSGSRIFQLSHGRDFFDGAYGSGASLDVDAAMADWADPRVQAAVQDRLRQRHGERAEEIQSWAQIVEAGMPADEAIVEHRRQVQRAHYQTELGSAEPAAGKGEQ